MARRKSTTQSSGFDGQRLERVYEALQKGVDEGVIPGAGICLGRGDWSAEPRMVGSNGNGGPALGLDTLFLVASLTKPVTATAVMMLVERGELTLDDPVARFVPRFAVNGKHEVQVRHLLTHTSGLPDMLPDNDKLRAAQQPLQTFIDEVCLLPLLFPSGTRVQYQSMGFAMLAEIVKQNAGVPLAEFLQRELFVPLGMNDTSLGWQPDKADRIAKIRISAEQEKTDWHWNTPYWLAFGAPWGGMITSPGDFARLCRMMLQQGTWEGKKLLSPATVRAMTTNQLAGMLQTPEEERRCRPWGLGWRLHWPGHSASFGDLLGPRTFGHWGATGTLCWLDPDAQAFLVLFTTQPQEPEGRFLARISNLAAAALE